MPKHQELVKATLYNTDPRQDWGRHYQDWEPLRQYQSLILLCQSPLDCVQCVSSFTKPKPMILDSNRKLGPVNQLTICCSNIPIIDPTKTLKSQLQMKPFFEVLIMGDYWSPIIYIMLRGIVTLTSYQTLVYFWT